MNITDFVGNTPLIKLQSENDHSADIYVKVEHFNAGASIKARVAKKMVEDAIKSGLLKTGMTVIEPTGGNTGIGLAIMSIIYGFNFVAVVPDNYSKDRVDLLRRYNAEVILSDSSTGNDSHILKAKELQQTNPTWVCLDQFKNRSCLDAHYFGTAQEILDKVIPDVFVAGVGSGGTFTGISRRLKQDNNALRCYVVQPTGCDILRGVAQPHKIQGISLGIIPPLLDYSLIDGTIEVDFEDVRDELLLLMKKEALFLGISSGANILAAKRIAQEIGKGKIVCTVAPDGGQYYTKEVFNI